MERGGDGQEDRPLGAGEPGELDRPLDRRFRSGDHRLAAAVVVGRLTDRAGEIEIARGLGRDPRRRAEIEAEDRRHRPFADRNRLLHRFAPQAQKTGGILETERAGGAKGRILAERVTGDISGVSADIEARFRLKRFQRGDANRHQGGLGVGGEREFGLGPAKHEMRQLLR